MTLSSPEQRIFISRLLTIEVLQRAHSGNILCDKLTLEAIIHRWNGHIFSYVTV